MTETLDPVLPKDLQEKADRVLDLACDKDLKLTTAESCTGGLLAALLTDVVGKSHIFERGFVSYSNEAKCDLLAVDAGKIDECGAVSEDVAVQMVKGALERSGADIGISITGFAGPAKDDQEEGLVHFACGRASETIEHREEHFGQIGRDGVRMEALRVSLEMLENALSH